MSNHHRQRAIAALAGLARLGGAMLEAWDCRHDPPCDLAEQQCARCERGGRDYDSIMRHVATLRDVIDSETDRMAKARREGHEKGLRIAIKVLSDARCMEEMPSLKTVQGWLAAMLHEEAPDAD